MSLLKVPFSFFVAFPVAGLGVGLATWLVFGLRFDLETSPGWQLVPYFLAMSCPLVMSIILGAQRSFLLDGPSPVPVAGSAKLVALGVTLAVGLGPGWVVLGASG